jgi:hypothetical protein
VAWSTTPAAVADAAIRAANATYNLPAPGLGNDWDIEGDPLTVVTTPVFIPMHGALTLNLDGSSATRLTPLRGHRLLPV